MLTELFLDPLLKVLPNDRLGLRPQLLSAFAAESFAELTNAVKPAIPFGTANFLEALVSLLILDSEDFRDRLVGRVRLGLSLSERGDILRLFMAEERWYIWERGGGEGLCLFLPLERPWDIQKTKEGQQYL